jgi:hypothetical protein
MTSILIIRTLDEDPDRWREALEETNPEETLILNFSLVENLL